MKTRTDEVLEEREKLLRWALKEAVSIESTGKTWIASVYSKELGDDVRASSKDIYCALHELRTIMEAESER